VCNWNTDNSTSSATSCNFCTLEVVDCTFINTTAQCINSWSPTFIITENGTVNFNCFKFNSDPNNVTWSETTSYGGSYVTVFKIRIPNQTSTPTAYSPRAGLQVTFAPQGTITPDIIYNEVRFLAINTDTFFAITAINTIHGDLPTTDPNYNTTRFDTTSSAVSLLNVPIDQTDDAYLSVSFAYQTLNLEVVTYGFAYTLSNFFGDFSGMLNLLLGVCLVKVFTCFPLGWASMKMRSCRPLEDKFVFG